jgi:hypothetical protein
MSVPLAIAEIVRAATRPAQAVSGEAAVTAGVEAALAAYRRYWSRQLLARLGDVPVTASGHRELIATLAEEFFSAADEIDDGRGRALAGLAEPAAVVAAGRCACCGGATWQNQARDICGRCGHSTQHEGLEVRLVSHPI